MDEGTGAAATKTSPKFDDMYIAPKAGVCDAAFDEGIAAQQRTVEAGRSSASYQEDTKGSGAVMQPTAKGTVPYEPPAPKSMNHEI